MRGKRERRVGDSTETSKHIWLVPGSDASEIEKRWRLPYGCIHILHTALRWVPGRQWNAEELSPRKKSPN